LCDSHAMLSFVPKLSLPGSFHLPVISSKSKLAAAKYLQLNHQRHHCFFDDRGLHNHCAHHVLAALALGASAERIEEIYRHHASYQRLLQAPLLKPGDLFKPDVWQNCLGKEQYYHDFMQFFEKELEENGLEETCRKHLFGETSQAKDLLDRFYAGLYHPFIHVGYGVEFGLLGIVAEGLAETAVQSNQSNEFFVKCEAVEGKEGLKLEEVFQQVIQDKRCKDSTKWEDSQKLTDGVFARAMGPLTNIVGQYKVKDSEIRTKAAEILNLATMIYAASHRPEKIMKFDFFIMHTLTSSVFLQVFIEAPWISASHKARLLERAAWMDIAVYLSRGSPALHVQAVENFAELPMEAGWLDIWKRAVHYDDDGHAMKTVRALANAQKYCEDKDCGAMKDEMFLKAGAMTMASVENFLDVVWVRSTGFDEAWADIPARQAIVSQKT